MNGILYFSSTGNSLYVAQTVQRELGGDVRYIPNYCADGAEYEKIILVSPIYSFGLPQHVFALLPQLRSRKVYIILTYGGMIAGADRLAYDYARENGVDVQGVYTLKMVENFTLSFSTPPFLNKLTLRGVPAKLERIVRSIASDEVHIPKIGKTRRREYETNKSNWYMLAKDFAATEDCIQCGKCVQMCPSRNITVEHGKIMFGQSCVACLGCYHRCPVKAIQYKKRNKKDRYFHPDVNEVDLGKDLLQKESY